MGCFPNRLIQNFDFLYRAKSSINNDYFLLGCVDNCARMSKKELFFLSIVTEHTQRM